MRRGGYIEQWQQLGREKIQIQIQKYKIQLQELSTRGVEDIQSNGNSGEVKRSKRQWPKKPKKGSTGSQGATMIFCRDLTTAQGLVPTGIDGDDDKMIIQRKDFCC